MRVGLFQEAQCPAGTSAAQRQREVIQEARLAEASGWDFYGPGEQHFLRGEATNTSPEVLLAAIAATTERIRLRPMAINFLRFNHPIRIAEQVATLDAIANGRVELCGARSNNPYTLDTFGIPATETALQRDEAIRILITALSHEEFEYHGELYDIPPARISPRPVQTPPPVSIASTGVEGHRKAGGMGIGVITGSSIIGWDYAQACIDSYRAGIAEAQPTAGYLNNCLSFSSIGVNCHADRDRAKEAAAPVALRFVEIVLQITEALAKKSPDYAYMAETKRLREHADDLDYLLASSPYITIGNPDDLIERAQTLHSMGADEIVWRIDGMGHEENKRAIEMIGRHVLPAVHEFPPHPGSTPAPGADAKENG